MPEFLKLPNDMLYSTLIRDEMIITLKTIAGKNAADIGAGEGFISEGLINAGLIVTAVEYTPERIGYIKEKFYDIKEFKALLAPDGNAGLGNEEADYAFSHMFLHRQKKPPDFIKDIHRILKTGGKAAISGLINRTSGNNSDDINNGFTLPDIYEWFVIAGFRNISIEKFRNGFTTDNEDNIVMEVFLAYGEK